MKVIAQTGNGFLLEATPDEIANICGYYSAIAPEFDPTVAIGDEIQVSEIFSKFTLLLGKKADIELALSNTIDAKTKLESSIQTLEEIGSPIVESE